MDIKIALAGNPNCGKTTLFNALTGSSQYVGNWPGVTVEKKEGRLKGHKDTIVETAKANGLRPFRYFQFLLERLPVGTPADDCLPWNDAAQDLCR